MIMRRLLIGLVVLLVAIQVVRIAAVQSLARSRPADAARVWSGHPDAELEAGLTAIAMAARDRKTIGPGTFAQIYDAAGKDPLAPDPFLVRGVQAQLSGDARLAEQAFLAAQWRDGRSLPARYFLADLYFRRGDSRRGLSEVGALARLAPDGVQNLAPYVAAYARNRSAWPQLRVLFRSEPRLEDNALIVLAADARNAEAVLALANPGRSGPASPWLAPLLQTLVKAGQYERARRIWAAVSRVPLDRGALLFDPGFTRSGAPPPFNWDLTSSTTGFAERQRDAGLHVIYYGQEDGPLASQLLVLPPGQYRFITQAAGRPTNDDALQWRLTCVGGKEPISSIPLSAAVASPWTFAVPADCRGQRLELFGSSSGLPKQSEATIRGVRLVRERPNA
jgi:hypothetical protein